MERVRLRRQQPARRHRQGGLFPERGWLADAGPEGPEASGPAPLRSCAAIVPRGRATLPHEISDNARSETLRDRLAAIRDGSIKAPDATPMINRVLSWASA